MFGGYGSFFCDSYKGMRDVFVINLYLFDELSYSLMFYAIAMHWRRLLDVLGTKTIHN